MKPMERVQEVMALKRYPGRTRECYEQGMDTGAAWEGGRNHGRSSINVR